MIPTNTTADSSGVRSLENTVQESIAEDIEFMRNEWLSRTRYGRLRVVPVFLIHIALIPFSLSVGVLMVALLRVFKAVSEVVEKLSILRDGIEPAVYHE